MTAPTIPQNFTAPPRRSEVEQMLADATRAVLLREPINPEPPPVKS